MGIETLTLSSALQMGGTAMSALGAVNSSRASRGAYDAQAQVARNNAQIAGWQAEDALARGQRNASIARGKTAQLKGTQRARLAGNGVDLGVGSALNILTDTDYFGAVDAGTITDNAAREAWAIRNQAANFSSEAGLMQSRADAESPWMAGATSLLTSASKVGGNWFTGLRTPTTRRGHDTFAEGQY